MNRFFQLLSRRKVYKQLSTIFLCAVMLPILLLGGIVAVYSCTKTVSSYEDLTTSDTMRLRSILLNVTTNFYDISEDIKAEEDLYKLINAEYASTQEAVSACIKYTHFRSLMDKQPSISTLKLYVPETSLAGASDNQYFYPATSEIRNTDWYQQASTQAFHFWKSKVRTDRNHNNYWELNFFCKIPIVSTGEFAVLSMTVSDNYLRSLIESNTLETFVSVNEEPCFYTSNRKSAGYAFPSEVDYTSTYYQESGFLNIDGKTSIGAINTLVPYRSNDRLYILSTDMDSVTYITKITLSYLAILIISILVPFTMIHVFTKYFSSRVETLRQAMHKVSNNDYELVDAVQGDDELSATFTDLKTMVERVKETEASIYETRISQQRLENQQQQMEYKLLASQINPHFLYNTLETIRMKAFSEGNQEVANAIKLLGKSMRYVLHNTGTTPTTLEKELDYIKTYLAIQKLRFGERLNYQIRVDEELTKEDYQILPLLLQPVVENSISHGLEDSDSKGQLQINLQKIQDNLQVEIFDNGIGMNEAELADLNNNIKNHPKDSADSIGLFNINQRITLYYGEEYGMEIKSRKNEGTLVIITIPLCN